MSKESLPGSLSAEYAYDEASNLIGFTDAGGSTHYFYNWLNELIAMYEPGGNCEGAPIKCTHAEYDGAGSLTKLEFPAARIEHLLQKRDPALLAGVMQELEGKSG